MLLAIRAPPGTTLEVPSESQVKEMHSKAIKNKEDVKKVGNKNSSLQKHELDELMQYLEKKYHIFIKTQKPNNNQHQQQ